MHPFHRFHNIIKVGQPFVDVKEVFDHVDYGGKKHVILLFLQRAVGPFYPFATMDIIRIGGAECYSGMRHRYPMAARVVA